MVDIYTAYKIINKSVLKVVNDMVVVDIEEPEIQTPVERLNEAPFPIAERRRRLQSVIVGHDLKQYVNKFYSITLDSNEVVPLDYLIQFRPEDIDLTEFGDKL